MTTHIYINTLKSLTDLPKDILDDLIQLADSLTESERKKTVTDMQSIHTKIVANRSKTLSLYEKGVAIVQRFLRSALPSVRRFEENVERRQDTQSAERKLDFFDAA